MKPSSPSISPSLSQNLESLRIVEPCPKKWADMAGDGKKRFCEHCNLHVHNLSAMKPRQIQALAQTPGRRCVAYLETADGRIRTRSRLDFFRHSLSRSRRLAASLLALLFPFSFVGCTTNKTGMVCPPPAPTRNVPREEIMVPGGVKPLPPENPSSAKGSSLSSGSPAKKSAAVEPAMMLGTPPPPQ